LTLWNQERAEWSRVRGAMEQQDFENWQKGAGRYWAYKAKHQAILILGGVLKAIGLFQLGFNNAKNIRVNTIDVPITGLPKPFEGYRILHLSDLHLDSISGMDTLIADKIASIEYDLCLMTGDFRYARHGDHRPIVPFLHNVVTAIRAKDGVFTVLGNHDTEAMTRDFEQLGVQVLANQGTTVSIDSSELSLIGVDDPHDYHTKAADCCLANSGNGFKVLMAHSPELYKEAAENEFHLYLCGHSHGGQICLPGGRALITFLNTGKEFYRGLWRYKKMAGHTSSGCSTAKIPVRFNCPPEITVLTLRSAA
jgi:uncharacterized protein